MKVYKFRGGKRKLFKRDLACLVDNKVWYSLLSELNDPLEGSIDHNYLRDQVHKLNRRYRASNKSAREEAMRILFSALDGFIQRREKVGIYALSTTFKNEPLWAYYGFNHEGFCIEYDLELLNHSYTDQPIYKIKVEYSETRPQLTTKDLDALRKNNFKPLLQKLLGTKSKGWGNEDEIRLISDDPGLTSIKENAVTAIYFGHRMKSRRKTKMMSELSGKNIQFYQMHLDEKNYGITSELLK